MIYDTTFPYKPSEHESEKASNSYLMSLVALVAVVMGMLERIRKK